MKYLFCLIGLHNWNYSGYIPHWLRKCKRCKKEQRASYDMSIGETIWENL